MRPKIKSFKKRKINWNAPVKIYRNLTMRSEDGNPWYSIMQENRVVGHTKIICIKPAKFIVNEKVRQKVLRDKKKYVHAFVEGLISCESETGSSFDIYLKYNPYDYHMFYYINATFNKVGVSTAKKVKLGFDGMKVVL